MQISSIRIENFRSFKDETIPFNNYTCLVGPNGAGKSNVLTALNVFFRESDGLPTDLHQLDQEDFHCKDTEKPIKITIIFTNLSQEAKKDFSDYVRQDQLAVSAEAIFDKSTGKAEVKQYGQRLVMQAFMPFFRAIDEKIKVPDLKNIYNGLQKAHKGLPNANTKQAMIDFLREYEAERPDDCKLIPSKDQFYGFSKGINRLAKHIQWVYVPAVKDATSEQVEARNSALGKLLARTVRSKANFDESVKNMRTGMQEQYQKLLDGNQHILDDISKSLQARLAEWAHPDARLRLQWKQDPDKSVRVEEPWAHILAGEGDFEGALARFGHGLQRSYLLALLHELSGTEANEGPTLILACEEPELYQHPPQARHLASVLNRLSHGNSQVIISTHSPWFVSGKGFEDVRMVRKEDGSPSSSIYHMSFEDIIEALAEATDERPTKPEGALAKVHQALQPALNEMFFTRRLILVEGLEDKAYLESYFILLDKLDEFRRLGCHIVPTNGKSKLLRPLVISKHMKIPTYLIFDADTDKFEENGRRIKHEKDNKALLNLVGKAEKDAFPDETIWGKGFTIWHSDIGAIVKEEIGVEVWKNYQQRACHIYGQVGGLKKNYLHICESLSFAWDDGKRSKSIERLCHEILDPENIISIE